MSSTREIQPYAVSEGPLFPIGFPGLPGSQLYSSTSPTSPAPEGNNATSFATRTRSLITDTTASLRNIKASSHSLVQPYKPKRPSPLRQVSSEIVSFLARLETEMPAQDYRPQKPQRQTSYISSFIRWLQLKNYQYEVTFSLYMLTPTEKFIFNFVLFVLFSLLVAAASLYLPAHVALMYNRIWYYVHGEFANITGLHDSVETLTITPTVTRKIAVETVKKMGEL